MKRNDQTNCQKKPAGGRGFNYWLRLHTYISRKNSKVQKRGKINLIGRLQLTTERMREEENEGIVQLRILRTQVRRHHDHAKRASYWAPF